MRSKKNNTEEKIKKQNEIDHQTKKFNKSEKNIATIFKRIPTIIKITGIVVLLFIIIFLGIKYSKTMNHKETVLEFGFKDVGELVTQEWYGRVLEDSTKDRKLFNKYSIPFTKSRIIFSLDVEVTAGLNFEEIEWEKISEEEILIKLPKSKIYKYYQVPNTFNSYLDDESWFTNIDSKERHQLEDEVVEKGKNTALEAGILDKADKNAKTIITQMVKSQDKNLKIKWENKE